MPSVVHDLIGHRLTCLACVPMVIVAAVTQQILGILSFIAGFLPTMGMHSETHHMFVQILICVSAAHNHSLMQYTSTSIRLCLWEQKILAYFNSMMASRSSLFQFNESTTDSACPPRFLINFLNTTKEEYTSEKFRHKTI